MNRKVQLLLALIGTLVVFSFQNCSTSKNDNLQIGVETKNNGGGYPGLVVNGSLYAKPGETVTFNLSGGLPPYNAGVVVGDGQLMQTGTAQFTYTTPNNSAPGVHNLQFNDSLNDSINWNLQISHLIVENTDEYEGFGNAIKVAGDTLVVGASRDSSTEFLAGAVYIFKKNFDSWHPYRKLTLPNLKEAHFGASFAVDEKQLVVGAPSCTNDSDCNSEITPRKRGRVFVFDREGDNLAVPIVLEAPDASAGDKFGVALALEGDTLAVSNMEDRGLDGSGAVYLFKKQNGVWTFVEKLKGLKGQKLFGRRIVLDGGRLVIISGGVETIGCAHFFEILEKGTAVLVNELFQSNPAIMYSWFGDGVSIDGDRLYLNEYSDGKYLRILEVSILASGLHLDRIHKFETETVGNSYRRSLSVNNGVMIVGSQVDTIDGKESAGSVTVFKKLEDGNFSIIKTITMPQPKAFEGFGKAVHIQEGEIYATGTTRGIVTLIRY